MLDRKLSKDLLKSPVQRCTTSCPFRNWRRPYHNHLVEDNKGNLLNASVGRIGCIVYNTLKNCIEFGAIDFGLVNKCVTIPSLTKIDSILLFNRFKMKVK